MNKQLQDALADPLFPLLLLNPENYIFFQANKSLYYEALPEAIKTLFKNPHEIITHLQGIERNQPEQLMRYLKYYRHLFSFYLTSQQMTPSNYLQLEMFSARGPYVYMNLCGFLAIEPPASLHEYIQDQQVRWREGRRICFGYYNFLLQALNVKTMDIGKAKDFRGANLKGINFSHKKFVSVNFVGADLSGANFYQAIFLDANFSDATLSGAQLRQAEFSLAKFSRANLLRSDLSFSKFPGVDFSNANLSGAYIRHSTFSRANLSGANLTCVTGKRADYSDANLAGANFSQADLEKANFSRANLSGANFDRAKLDCAKFSAANLSYAKFTNLFIHSSFRLEETANCEGTSFAGTKYIIYRLLENQAFASCGIFLERVQDINTAMPPIQQEHHYYTPFLIILFEEYLKHPFLHWRRHYCDLVKQVWDQAKRGDSIDQINQLLTSKLEAQEKPINPKGDLMKIFKVFNACVAKKQQDYLCPEIVKKATTTAPY
jgi:uncharacterized protein YjbI with pentapeptide repeats